MRIKYIWVETTLYLRAKTIKGTNFGLVSPPVPSSSVSTVDNFAFEVTLEFAFEVEIELAFKVASLWRFLVRNRCRQTSAGRAIGEGVRLGYQQRCWQQLLLEGSVVSGPRVFLQDEEVFLFLSLIFVLVLAIITQFHGCHSLHPSRKTLQKRNRQLIERRLSSGLYCYRFDSYLRRYKYIMK